MLEAIVMTIGTIVFGVIIVFVALFSVVSILVETKPIGRVTGNKSGIDK